MDHTYRMQPTQPPCQLSKHPPHETFSLKIREAVPSFTPTRTGEQHPLPRPLVRDEFEQLASRERLEDQAVVRLRREGSDIRDDVGM